MHRRNETTFYLASLGSRGVEENVNENGEGIAEAGAETAVAAATVTRSAARAIVRQGATARVKGGKKSAKKEG